MPKPIQVLPHDPTYPQHFQRIASKLKQHLHAGQVPYTTIEHIGSTAIPDVPSKPNIDIVILVPTASAAESARDALMYLPEPTEYYKCIGDGGIRGRISMKFQDYLTLPTRSVYIVSEDCKEGMLSMRGWRCLRDVLRREENRDLREEYGRVKMKMVEEGCAVGVWYGRRKNEVIRKILKRGGWTDEEVGRKEALDTRSEVWVPDWEL